MGSFFFLLFWVMLIFSASIQFLGERLRTFDYFMSFTRG